MEFDKLKAITMDNLAREWILTNMGFGINDGKCYLVVVEDGLPKRTVKEYAQLFAAAPELYEAAKNALLALKVRQCEECDPHICFEIGKPIAERNCNWLESLSLSKAIAKAEGRNNS